MARSLALSLFVLTFGLGTASAQDCRDATGEPTPCPYAETPAPAPVAEMVPAPAPAPEPMPALVTTPSEPTPDPFRAFVAWETFLDIARPAALPFTQLGASRAPELARDALLTNAPEVVIGGVSLALGARPLPWLRVPELRLSFGGADYEAEPGSWSAGAAGQAEEAQLGSLFVVRAEIGAGVEVPIDDVSLFAMGQIAVAGYFLEADLGHPTAGSLGTATLTSLAWEAGWTLGVAGRVGDDVRLSAAYRHVHTGAEADEVRFSVEFDGQ